MYNPSPSSYPYTPYDAFIPDPELYLAFPPQKESLTLDSAFDQSPALKKIKDYYVRTKPSVQTCVSQLSPADFTPSAKQKVKRVYSTITPSLVSVSFFEGVRRRIDCSGLIIDWNSRENEATILTSAKLLWRTKRSTFEFHLVVRMADGTLLLAREDRVDYYYNVVTLKVRSTIELKAVDLRSMQNDIADEMDVIALGREFYSCSLFDCAGKLHLDYLFFRCNELLRSTCYIPAFCEGGALITHSGCVIGINFFVNGACAHLPTSIILTCLEMWNSFSTVVRPWIGVSVVDVDQLPYEIWERYNVVCDESYAVVKEVYKGSPADKNGVCPGDVVATCNGNLILSAKQYSELLSERSQAATTSGDLDHQNFTVVIKPFERHGDKIIVEADYVAADDTRLNVCWPRAEDDWFRSKTGSQDNPTYNFSMLGGVCETWEAPCSDAD